MWGVIRGVLPIALLTASLAQIQAQELSNDDIRSFDDQIQEAKTTALSIAAELNVLEERLLYPSGTQLSIYLSIARPADVQPSAIEVRINGELATSHIYSTNELEALRKGGIQKLYVGNVQEGDHELHVTVTGKRGDGRDFVDKGQYMLTKDVEPRALSIRLLQPGDNGGGILIGER
ncbi:MAG: hypothetical protein OEZ11_04640 [Gammaproteobacteria bacterium]|nr:hypothetical protein [Gammaproteobacteria bacterium]